MPRHRTLTGRTERQRRRTLYTRTRNKKSLAMKNQLDAIDNRIQLLDLSDDVLLYILKYCLPRDLKALGFTCSRLGALVLDRTLWERVDARDQPVGMNRIQWLLKYAISPSTSELLISGYAKEVEGCMGRLNYRYTNQHASTEDTQQDAQTSGVDSATAEGEATGPIIVDESTRRGIIRSGPVVQIYDSMPRLNPHMSQSSLFIHRMKRMKRPVPSNKECFGPQFTLTSAVLKKLGGQCPNLTSLALEYCNLDCATTSIRDFPKTLKVLSLRGSKCFSQTIEKTFLFKIQDSLKLLEELNVSDCEWVEPSSLLPLSKLPALRRLYMRRCCKMCECVAYSSLATRYGFKSLQVIDLRESPVGDSEISSFGWVGSLEELYASPAPAKKRIARHGHYIGDVMPEKSELDPWEVQEPEYMDKLSRVEIPNDEETTESNDAATNTLKRRRTNSPRDCYDDDDIEYTLYGQKLSSIMPAYKGFGAEAKRLRQEAINDGASTSNSSQSPAAPAAPNSGEDQNGDSAEPRGENSDSSQQNRDPFGADGPLDGNNEARPQGPVQKVLYVNVCRRQHAMYRLSMPVYTIDEPADALGDSPGRRLNISNAPFMSQDLDPATLVSDASIHRFGRADTDNVNYINIGPNGIQRDHRASRPDRSNLRVLHVSGFRNITNRSLVHLATAAPRLRLLDVTGTRVNQRGVENFKSLRSDCEVIYTKEEEQKQA